MWDACEVQFVFRNNMDFLFTHKYEFKKIITTQF